MTQRSFLRTICGSPEIPLPLSMTGPSPLRAQWIRFITLQRAADVGHPVLAIKLAKLRRAAPVVIDQGDAAVALPLVPAFIAKGEDLSQRRPIQQVVAARQVRLVADLIHADVH